MAEITKSVVCGFVAACAGVLVILATQNGHFSPTALVNIAATDPMARLAREADPSFDLVTPRQHYDGTYYYAIARDPMLLGTEHKLIDQATYRYGHPFHGWLAGVLSAGQATAVPIALLALSVCGLAIAGWGFSRLALQYGKSPWVGLVVAFSPGLLYAATVDTSETVGAALIALSFLAWLRHRITIAAFLMVALCLDKEPYITVPLGILAWEMLQACRRRELPNRWAAKIPALAAGPIALSAWYLYVHSRQGAWPWSYEPGNLGAPLRGWLETFARAHTLSTADVDFSLTNIVTAAPAVLIATALIIVVAAVAASRLHTIFDGTLIGLAIITSLQGWLTLLSPREMIRTPAIAVLLSVFVLLTRPQRT